MAGISWIKLNVEIFDDQKIKIIKKLPNGKDILLIWFQILTLAGKTNDEGLIYLSRDIPYDIKTLSIVLDEDDMVIKIALDILVKFGMLDLFENGVIFVSNWGKHQSEDRLKMIREQTRKRVEKHRKKLRQKALSTGGVAANKTEQNDATIDDAKSAVTLQVTQSNATEEKIELELELEEEKEEEKTNSNPQIIFEIEKILLAEIRGSKRLEYVADGDFFEEVITRFAEYWTNQDGRTIVPLPRKAKSKDWAYQNSKRGILASFAKFCSYDKPKVEMRVVAENKENIIETCITYVQENMKRWRGDTEDVTWKLKKLMQVHSLEDFKLVIDWFKDAEICKSNLGNAEIFVNKFPNYLERSKKHFKTQAA